MAGIGFELRKVASLGSARGLFQASLSGIMIVAGPWLISIITILIFQQPVLGIPVEIRNLFISSTIYIYASSLILNGGFHYIFTRILSDYLYRNEMDKAMGLTVRYLLASMIMIIPVAVGLQRLFLGGPAVGTVHKTAFILLYTIINHVWVLMLTASAMKRYNQLLVAYSLGMSASLLFMKGAMIWFDSSYILMAFTTGQLLLMLLLFFYLWKEMGYRRVGIHHDFIRYIKRYRALFISGFFYYGALWIDKIIFWGLRGDFIADTSMKLYKTYDIIVYLTNLMMIPGLVFFTIFSETEFFLVLKKFLDSLGRKPLRHIKTNQYQLNKTTRFILREQAALQGCVSLIFLSAAWFRPEMREAVYPMVIFMTASGIMVLGLFLTVMNFLFYIELYGKALQGVLLFFPAQYVRRCPESFPSTLFHTGILHPSGLYPGYCSNGFSSVSGP